MSLLAGWTRAGYAKKRRLARHISLLLKILPHQRQYRLRHRLPRPWVRDARDLTRHIHRFGGQVYRALGVDIEGFQRWLASRRVGAS